MRALSAEKRANDLINQAKQKAKYGGFGQKKSLDGILPPEKRKERC